MDGEQDLELDLFGIKVMLNKSLQNICKTMTSVSGADTGTQIRKIGTQTSTHHSNLGPFERNKQWEEVGPI